MKSYFRQLEVPVASGQNGASFRCEDYRDKTIQIYGTFNATLEIQVSLDGGTTFFSTEQSITEPGVYQVPQTCTHLHIRNVTHIDGTPLAVLGAFDARSDGG